MRSTIHAASAVRVVERQREQVAALPRLVAGRDHRLRQPLAGGDALGDRAAELDHALARPEVVVERDLPDAGVALRERDDVRDLAAAPLVDRLVVVADDAQVRAEPHQAADESLLQRVDVLVLVDDDVADVVPDVILDAHEVVVLVRVALEVVDGAADDLRVVEERVLVGAGSCTSRTTR